MKNWEAIYECEDEHDADRLQKRAAASEQSRTMTAALQATIHELDFDGTMDQSKSAAKEDFKLQQAMLLLQQSNWIDLKQKRTDNRMDIDQSEPAGIPQACIPEITEILLKKWKDEIRKQEEVIAHSRSNALNPEGQTARDAPVMEMGINNVPDDDKIATNCPPTKARMCVDEPLASIEEILENIATKFTLNSQQIIAFKIIAKHFIKKYVDNNEEEPPLRMLMTGPGGTGKTHIVNALKEVMAHFGCEHKIRYLAPTGSAASLIDGMTIHKGLGIKINVGDKGKGNQNVGESTEDYTILISVKNKSQLREEWANVDIILIDEASLFASQLLSEVDHALRYAKEQPNEPFGGISVIFAGDFYQYPPVRGSLLYTPISKYAGQTNAEIQKRLGRMAWKTVDTVITLTEQKRMKDDVEYGQAVQCLGVCECNKGDIELFNSQLIKSAGNPGGIDMGCDDNTSAAAIVNTNKLHELINIRKAESNCVRMKDSTVQKVLTMCTALDRSTSERHPDQSQS